jgi:hypothetical protein
MSDWVLLRLGCHTVLVQLNDTHLGTATINCWADLGYLVPRLDQISCQPAPREPWRGSWASPAQPPV